MKTAKKEAEKFADGLKYAGDRLVPVAVCDAASNQLLMLAYANREAVVRTLTSGRAYFFSRSRNELWRKGETSGNTMKVFGVNVDCDSDTLQYLVEVEGDGNACHTGKRSCFGAGTFSLYDLERLVEKRKKKAPQGSYTAKLLKDRNLCAIKIIEESKEVAEAFVEKHGKERVSEEAADVIYHLLALLASEGITIKDVERVLGKRNSQNKRR